MLQYDTILYRAQNKVILKCLQFKFVIIQACVVDQYDTILYRA